MLMKEPTLRSLLLRLRSLSTRQLQQRLLSIRSRRPRGACLRDATSCLIRAPLVPLQRRRRRQEQQPLLRRSSRRGSLRGGTSRLSREQELPPHPCSRLSTKSRRRRRRQGQGPAATPWCRCPHLRLLSTSSKPRRCPRSRRRRTRPKRPRPRRHLRRRRRRLPRRLLRPRLQPLPPLARRRHAPAPPRRR